MGYWSASYDQAVITDVVAGGEAAIRSPTAFIPDHSFQESEVARIYAESGRTSVYLGDWHSHPGGTSALSPTDRDTLRSIVRAREARLRVALMVIASGGPTWTLTAWIASRSAWFPRRIGIGSGSLVEY
jgi:integrative and conjugative element protein (TIGR02256 family)